MPMSIIQQRHLHKASIKPPLSLQQRFIVLKQRLRRLQHKESAVQQTSRLYGSRVRSPGPIIIRDAGDDVLFRHRCLSLLDGLAVVFGPARFGDFGLAEDAVKRPCDKQVCVHVQDSIVLSELEEAEFCELVDPTRFAGSGSPVCGIEEGDLDYGCAFFGEDALLLFGDVGRDDD